MKTINIFLSLLLVCSLLICSPLTSYANVSNEKSLPTSQYASTSSFIKTSTVKTFEDTNGNYNITITDAPFQYENNRNKEEFTTKSMSCFSLQEEEKNELLKSISDIKNQVHQGQPVIQYITMIGF